MKSMTAKFGGSLAFLTVVTGIAGIPEQETFAQEAVVGDLELPDGKVHYEVAGSGPPVVLVHGGVMDLRMWDPQMADFTKRHRVIRFDLRGFGRSPAPAGPYSPADDIAALLDHLDIERAAVVGLSMGGGVAVDFALAHPERVEALVLAEPGLSGHRFSPEVMASMQQVGAALMQNDFDAAVQAFLDSPALSQVKNKPVVLEKVERMIRDNIGGLMAAQLMRLKETRQIDRLPDIRAPTLVLVSEHAGQDALTITERVATQAPRASKVIIENSGHLMNLENRERFNEVVLAFLRPGE